MQLDEFNRLNLHDSVRYQDQLHTVVHLNRRSGKAYLRPAPGWGPIVGPVSCFDVTRPTGKTTPFNVPVVVLADDATLPGSPISDDSATDVVVWFSAG